MSKFNFEIQDSKELARVILNNGFHATQDPSSDQPLSIQDAVSSTDLGPLIPQSLVEIMVEAQEPIMTLSPLLDRVSWQAGTQEFKIPAMGVLDVDRIAEGETYPEKRIQMGGASATATIDKWGAALSFTEEAIKNSRWDIVGLTTRELGRAFMRRKEVETANFLRSLAVPVFDNVNPTMSAKGTTSGRSSDLTQNGTLTLDDLFEMYAALLHTGFTPDTLILHPLTWLMFIKDPILRSFAFQNGGGVIFGGYTGSPVNKSSFPESLKQVMSNGNPNAGMGTRADGGTAPSIENFSTGLNSAPQIPSFFPTPMRIVVSPFQFFDPARRLTDIVMADSSAMGAMVVAENLATDQWNDIRRDVSYMKFRERYGFLMYHEGLGMSVARNVKVDTNYWTGEPARPSFDVLSGSFPAYSATTAISFS